MNDRILLVEDDEYLRQLYFDILTQEKFIVEAASNGLEALAKIKQGGWNLVLLDLMLPGIDGVTILNNLKNDPTFKRSFPIVCISNLDSTPDLEIVKDLTDGYIIKSNLNPNEFISEIKKYLVEKNTHS